MYMVPVFIRSTGIVINNTDDFEKVEKFCSDLDFVLVGAWVMYINVIINRLCAYTVNNILLYFSCNIIYYILQLYE